MAIASSIRRRAHYGWAIFAMSFANLSVEGGIKNSEAVFFVALRDSFGSGTAAAGIFSAAGLVGAFSAPFLGKILDRVGPRRMFPMAALLILFGWVASSFATDLWQLFVLYSFFESIGQTSISSFANNAVLAPWFPQSRGRVLGLADAGNPTGQLVFTPLASVLVGLIGWRGAYRVFGVIFFLLVAPSNFLFQRPPPSTSRTSPEALPAQPADVTRPAVAGGSNGDGEAMDRAEAGRLTYAGDEPFLSTREILGRGQVWLLVSTRALGAIGNQMIRLHMFAFFLLAGYSSGEAVGALALAGVLNIPGRPIIGFLSDTLGREVSYTAAMALSIGAILLVLFYGSGNELWPLVVYVGLAGMSEGVSGLVVNAKAADIFPTRTLGTVMGLVDVGRGIGIAVGPILGGLLFDVRGDYVWAFSIAIIVTIASMFTMWSIGSGAGPKPAAVEGH